MQAFLTLDAARLPEDAMRRHAAFLAAAQQADGGFPGRRGPSDLYYTGFALRGLALAGGLDGSLAARAAEFLRQQIGRPMSAADFFSLATSAILLELVTRNDVFAVAGRDRRREVGQFFAPFRRPDGGYAKTERGASSTYQTFLVAWCKQLAGAEPDEPEPLIRLIRSRQRPDGGFVEIDAMRQSGTNPTAAAAALLGALGGRDEAVSTAAVKFLAGMQIAEGGLRANARIPAADLLSTFTGLWTLADLGAAAAIDQAAARRFVRSLEQPGGGFRAGAWDQEADVEYTFYGLGATALLG